MKYLEKTMICKVFFIYLFFTLWTTPIILAKNDFIIGKKYYITSAFNHKCLKTTDPLKKDTPVQLWQCTHTENQEITFVQSHFHEDLLEIVFNKTGECISIANDPKNPILQKQTCDFTVNQSFQVIQKGPTYIIQSQNGNCIDINTLSRENGTTLQLKTCNQSVQQKYFIYSVNHEITAPPLLLTVQNKENDPHTQNFKSTLTYWKWEYEVLGLGLTWKGFGTKFIEYLKRLNQLHDKNQIVIFSDSTDVLSNGPPDEFVKNYLRISQWEGGNRIISSAEMACCVTSMQVHRPGDFILPGGVRKNKAVNTSAHQEFTPDIQTQWQEEMEEIKKREGQWMQDSAFHYLNSGMIVGRAKDLIKMLEYVKAEENESDQALLSEYFLRFPDRVQLDYQNILFSNAHGWSGWETLNGCFFAWDETQKHFLNTQTQSIPTLIHNPAKYWHCYHWLLEQMNHSFLGILNPFLK